MNTTVRAWALLALATTAQARAAATDSQIDARSAGPAPETDPDAVALELYTPPHNTSLTKPNYPRSAATQGKEGWVRLNFMVDTEGKAYEIAVTDSIGDPVFQEAAVRALGQSDFEPANFQGQPLDAGHSVTYQFEMEGGSMGARVWFVRVYKALMDAINNGDREDADEYLARIGSRDAPNLYEDAYLHVAKSAYYANWGDEGQQLKALNRAADHGFSQQRLPAELFIPLQRARFLLLVQSQDYARAIQTFEFLAEHSADEAPVAALQTVVDSIEALRTDDRGYSVRGDFGDRTSWHYKLFKDEFFFDDVDGEIEEIKLRCQGKYVFFRFDPNMQYKIGADYQPCYLELIGDPATTFKLTQL